jgi:hypothetical protein
MKTLGWSRLFIFGVLVFFFARTYLIIAPASALQTTRLGDDSLSYLWSAKSNFVTNTPKTAALNDILMQRYLKDQPDQKLRWERSNTAQRTMGMITPSYSIVAAVVLKSVADLRWSFAILEMLCLILMTFGMAWFLHEVIGTREAGLAMLLMAFSVWPNQGIYAFIPGTCALSSALCLWAYLWKNGLRAKWWIVVLLSIWIAGFHPIGKMYLAFSPILLFIRSGITARGGYWKIVAACSAGVLVITVLPVLFPAMAPPPSEIMGGIGESAQLMSSVVHVAGWLYDPLIRNNYILVALFLGGLIFAPRTTMAGTFGRLFLGVSIMLLGSLLHWLPGYPAELFSRILVLFGVFAAAAGAKFFFNIYDEHTRIRRAVQILCWVAFLSTVIKWVCSYVPHTMNWRDEILYEDRFIRQLKMFEPGSTLVYADTLYALQTSLLLGGGDRGALVYPMLKGSPALDVLMNQRQPDALIVPGETALNSLARKRVKMPIKRQQGIALEYVHAFSLHRSQEHNFAGLLFLVDAKEGDGCWQVRMSGNGGRQSEQKLCLNTGKRWYGVNAADWVDDIVVEAPRSRAWLLGISKGDPREHVLWPWTTGWQLAYISNKKKNKRTVIDFAVSSLLAKHHAQELLRFVDLERPVLSDDSGMVFLTLNGSLKSSKKLHDDKIL